MKKVLLTLSNRGLNNLSTFPTFNSITNFLNKKYNLTITNPSSYNFKNNLLKKTFKYKNSKIIKDKENIIPSADFWLVYSDGYPEDEKAIGFKCKTDFVNAQIKFLQNFENSIKILNKPTNEQKTQKKYFTELSPSKYAIIPTYLANSKSQLESLLEEKKELVAKPNIGGGRFGIEKINSTSNLEKFFEIPEPYVFQEMYPGNETRIWFLDEKAIGARTAIGRRTPWSNEKENYQVLKNREIPQLEKKIKDAKKILKGFNIEEGIYSVDFMADKVNEINGAGLGFTFNNKQDKQVVDYRPKLINYLSNKIKNL